MALTSSPHLTQCCSLLLGPLAPRTSLACVCCLPPPFCSLAPPFCLALAFCWGESPSSQLPSKYLLTLRWKVSKLQEQDENSLLLSSTFRMGTWECEAFLAAYYVYSYHLHEGWQGRNVTSVIYTSQQDSSALYPSLTKRRMEG